MMTKAEYMSTMDARFEIGRARFMAMVATMDKESFLAQASDAWDRAREKYGPHYDLDVRNKQYEAGKEAVDGISYLAVDDVEDLGLAARQLDKKSAPIRFDEVEGAHVWGGDIQLDVE